VFALRQDPQPRRFREIRGEYPETPGFDTSLGCDDTASSANLMEGVDEGNDDSVSPGWNGTKIMTILKDPLRRLSIATTSTGSSFTSWNWEQDGGMKLVISRDLDHPIEEPSVDSKRHFADCAANWNRT